MKFGQWVATLAGLWLMAAPALFEYADAPAADVHRTVGPLFVTFGVVALWPATRDVRWLNVPAAIAVALAPLFGGHPSPTAAVGMLTAAVVIALTPFGGSDPAKRGAGWRAITGEGPSA